MIDEKYPIKVLKILSDRTLEKLWPNQDNGFMRRIILVNKGKSIHNPTMKEFVRGKRK